MTESPFIPGARVAVGDKFADSVTEGFVDKAYKGGNFTLRGSKQQWRPWCTRGSAGPRWSAMETGSGWARRRLDIWDATTDKEISEKVEAHKARLKWRDLRSKLEAVKEPTLELCDAIEAALAITRPQEKTQ